MNKIFFAVVLISLLFFNFGCGQGPSGGSSVPSWSFTTIDIMGFYPKLALDSLGNPHVAYKGFKLNTDLAYAGYDGNSWSKITIISNCDEYDIAVNNDDLPYIFYRDGNNLLVATIESSVMISSLVKASSSPSKISAKIDRSGVIHVVYVLNNGSLTYLSKEASSSWSLPATISTESSSYVSLAVDGNNVPGVAYQTSGGLKFAKLQASVWNVELVTAEAGDYVSFSFDQSNEPNISYRSIPVNDLKCAKKTGSSWEIETVESAGDCGGWSSITFDINGFPHICYIKDSLYVKHAWKTTSTWETESVVFGEALDSWFIGSLKPKICYMDNGTLKFAEYK